MALPFAPTLKMCLIKILLPRIASGLGKKERKKVNDAQTNGWERRCLLFVPTHAILVDLVIALVMTTKN